MGSARGFRRHIRRLVTAAAVCGALALGATLVPAAHAGDALGGGITRKQVIDRAWTWVKRDIQYSQSGTAKDAERKHRYRRDCSGFISMAWHIKPTGMGAPTTWTLPDKANRIKKRNLKRGDILTWPHHHAVLFHKWANRAHTKFWLFEMSNPTSDMNHRVAYLSSYSDYKAYRYKRIRS